MHQIFYGKQFAIFLPLFAKFSKPPYPLIYLKEVNTRWNCNKKFDE